MGDTFRNLDHESRRNMTETQEPYGNTNYLSFFVTGIPLAQGRPRFRRAGKVVQTYEPATSKSWKESVRWQAIEYMRKEKKGMIEGAMEASLVFLLPRPKSLPKKVKHHTKKPDLDNLEKSIFDALEGIAYKNDSQICKMTGQKLYESKIPGVSMFSFYL